MVCLSLDLFLNLFVDIDDFLPDLGLLSSRTLRPVQFGKFLFQLLQLLHQFGASWAAMRLILP